MLGIFLSLLGWCFLFGYAHKHPIHGVDSALRGGGGDDEAPNPPQYQMPEWASGLPPEILNYIRQGVGKQVTEPSEYGISSQALQQMLQYQPSQFAYPMEDIQKALDAQQSLQMQDYLEQIRPIMANQGQLDSSSYTNLVSDFLRGQQTQRYGTVADLLTNQANQNYQLNTWLPQYRASVAQALQGVGGARQGVQQYNMEYPYQTYIPALNTMYGQGFNLGDRQYQSLQAQYQKDLQDFQTKASQKSGMLGSLGTLGGAGIGFLVGGPAGAMLGASLGGAASPLWGGSTGSSGVDLGSAMNYAFPQTQKLDISGLGTSGLGTSSIYRPQWSTSKLGSQLYGY